MATIRDFEQDHEGRILEELVPLTMKQKRTQLHGTVWRLLCGFDTGFTDGSHKTALTSYPSQMLWATQDTCCSDPLAMNSRVPTASSNSIIP